METIALKNKTSNGEPLEAIFLPGYGMNIMSYKKGNIEVIDQSTRPMFEERYAGLGPLIGPHFHRRHVVPKVQNENAFPHIARCKALGINDPFSHGVGRYAPWKTESTDRTIKASLSGKEEWNGIQLAAIEGQNFKMEFHVDLTPNGLELALSVVSDSDSLVGIHYYYSLPQKTGKVISQVQNEYLVNGVKKPLDSAWKIEEGQRLIFDLDNEADFTFHPFPHPRSGRILLDAGSYQLETTYTCPSQENSWQLYHPRGASFVCIEPISSQDPRHPNLTVSSIQIVLKII